jgi:hypothetical protein
MSESEIEMDDRSGREVMDEYLEANKIHSLEMSNGIEALNKICNELGYREDGCRYGSSFEQFIQDNPDCTSKIIDWIAEQLDRNDEWKDSLMIYDEPEHDGN